MGEQKFDRRNMYEAFDPKNVSNWIQHSPEEFIEIISHEFKVEAEFIRGRIELMLSDSGSPEQRKRLIEQLPEDLLAVSDIIMKLARTAEAYVKARKAQE